MRQLILLHPQNELRKYRYLSPNLVSCWCQCKPYNLVLFVHENGKLPVVNFAAGGIATPADAALMMQLGAEGVFVGSGIFKSGNPAKRAQAIVKAVTNYNNPKMLAELSEDLGEAMVGINEQEIELIMSERGQ